MKVARELFGHAPRTQSEHSQMTYIKKQLQLAVSRDSGNRGLTDLAYAASVEEKKMLLKLYKQRLSPEQYKELRRLARKYQLVSEGTLFETN